MASMFRKKAIKNAVLHMRKGFIPEGNIIVPIVQLKERPDMKLLEKVVPTPEMCAVVSNLKEKNGMMMYRRDAKAAIAKGRRDPDTVDYSEFVLNHLYSTVVTALKLSRKAFKKMFFGSVGYIVT